MDNFRFSKEDYILHLLNKIEPDRCTRIRINKVAFFTEFGYIFKTRKHTLSDADYAAINMGPVVNDYRQLLGQMATEGKIKLDGTFIRPLVSPSVVVPPDVETVIDPLIRKYSELSHDELISLAHETDSYKITTDNDSRLGELIDKDLAQLETFFEDAKGLNLNDEGKVEEDLPGIDRSQLIKYDL